MLKIKNCGPIEFRQYIMDKKVFIYGAGRALEGTLLQYCRNKHVEAIIDKDINKIGGKIDNFNEAIEIVSVTDFIRTVKKMGKGNTVLVIPSQFYAAEIVKELDDIKELDSLECFLLFFVRNTKEKLYDFEFTVGKPKIPKIIHYVWFGGQPMPKQFEAYIQTWKDYNQDYEIIRWDESNYDYKKNDFVKEAYNAKVWFKVSDYARLDILYSMGGIYLDTDVEAIKNFDSLLNDECFFCLGNQDSVNNGCGMGGVKGNELLALMMEEYDAQHYDVEKGGSGLRSSHNYLNPAVKKYGFKLNNKYQKVGNAVLYPKEVMSPLTFGDMPDFFCEKTVSIHHEFGTWKKQSEKEGAKRLLDLYQKRINID